MDEADSDAVDELAGDAVELLVSCRLVAVFEAVSSGVVVNVAEELCRADLLNELTIVKDNER